MREILGSLMFIAGGVLLILFNRTVARWTEQSYASRVNRWAVWISGRFALTRTLTLPPKYYPLYWIVAGVLMVLVGMVDLVHLLLP